MNYFMMMAERRSLIGSADGRSLADSSPQSVGSPALGVGTRIDRLQEMTRIGEPGEANDGCRTGRHCLSAPGRKEGENDPSFPFFIPTKLQPL
jgi:hypothetical protein